MPDMEGSRYQILDRLGAGGMGVVYRARDTVLDREVALKVLADGRLGPAARDRLYREARAAARLESPNLVKIFDIGVHRNGNDKVHFIVMELVRGTTLETYLEGTRDPLARRVEYLVQAARAVHEAHLQGVIHRDLKPENIMVTTQGRIKIMDFGLAFVDDDHSLTRPGEGMGTILYMAPEQARGAASVDCRADVYALGGVLYRILTGQTPFTGTNLFELMARIFHEAPVPPSQHNPDSPPGFDEVVARALAKSPELRYATCEELANALERVMRPAAGPTRPSAAPSRPAADPPAPGGPAFQAAQPVAPMGPAAAAPRTAGELKVPIRVYLIRGNPMGFPGTLEDAQGWFVEANRILSPTEVRLQAVDWVERSVPREALDEARPTHSDDDHLPRPACSRLERLVTGPPGPIQLFWGYQIPYRERKLRAYSQRFTRPRLLWVATHWYDEVSPALHLARALAVMLDMPLDRSFDPSWLASLSADGTFLPPEHVARIRAAAARLFG